MSRKRRNRDRRQPGTGGPSARQASSADATRRRREWWLLAGAALAFLLGLLVYANTLNAEFTLDDVPIVAENEFLRDLDNTPAFFTTNYWGDSPKFQDKSLYRPLTILTYALNYAAHGYNPFGYHFINILLHGAASAMVVMLFAVLFGQTPVAIFAGVIFAVHPIHTEAVAGIVGRAEIMAALGTMACCASYARGVMAPTQLGSAVWLTLSVFAYAFACFSKEIGFIAPALILLWELTAWNQRSLLRFQPRALAAFVVFIAIAAMYLYLRGHAIKTISKNVGFVGISDIDRIWTGLRVCLEYVGLLLAPITLSADYWVTNVPIARGITEPGVLGALGALALLVGAMVWSWRRVPLLAWSIGAFLIALFPVSNLPFAIGVMKAERILYTASIGFVGAMAAALSLLWSRTSLRPVAMVAVFTAALLYAGRTWTRNKDWQDNRVLSEATLRTSPESVIFNTIIATEFRKDGNNEGARRHLEIALAGQPDNTTSLFNRGNIELDEKRFEEAVGYYRRALAVEPKYLSALNNLGRALAELKRFDEAAEVLEKSRGLRPDSPASYVNLLSIYIQTKNMGRALPLAEEALRRFPDVAAVHWNAGSVLAMVGRKEEAKTILRRAKMLDGGSTKRDIRTSLD